MELVNLRLAQHMGSAWVHVVIESGEVVGVPAAEALEADLRAVIDECSPRVIVDFRNVHVFGDPAAAALLRSAERARLIVLCRCSESVLADLRGDQRVQEANIPYFLTVEEAIHHIEGLLED